MPIFKNHGVQDEIMPFEIIGLSPMLKVTDLAQTILFYTQTIGFVVQNKMIDADGNLHGVH